METFRLFDMPPMTAAENMALDESLLALKGRGKAANTIRFLQFSPRAGVAQIPFSSHAAGYQTHSVSDASEGLTVMKGRLRNRRREFRCEKSG